MRAMAILTTVAALTALTACDRLGFGGGGNESTNASTNAAGLGKAPGGSNQLAAQGDGDKPDSGTIPASSSGAPALDRAYIVGRWTDNDDCGVAAEFAADGRFFANNGAQGLWNLQGDRLTMTGSSTLTLQIVPIDQNTMNVVNPDGSLGRSTRC